MKRVVAGAAAHRRAAGLAGRLGHRHRGPLTTAALGAWGLRLLVTGNTPLRCLGALTVVLVVLLSASRSEPPCSPAHLRLALLDRGPDLPAAVTTTPAGAGAIAAEPAPHRTRIAHTLLAGRGIRPAPGPGRAPRSTVQ
ncbi:hypothetical protein [Kitasatospora sp. NPDC050463]|uniref:hypothetical protein n=1 Tax=Kitasatospora sp. NPDC050463 TaxID=3155786 RepID=UPI0033CE32C9